MHAARNPESKGNGTNVESWSQYSHAPDGFYCGISFSDGSDSGHQNFHTAQGTKENLQKKLAIPGIDETKLIIAMTMYNESKEDLHRSIQGVCDNLIDLQTDALLKSTVVTVVLIADGEDRVDEGTHEYLASRDMFAPNHKGFTDAQNVDTTVMHIFASHHPLSPRKFKQMPQNMNVTLRLVYLLKKNNAKKLDSHSWILQGLAPMLRPEYVVFLDVGTRPKMGAIRMLVTEMRDDPNVAGCCGEITIDKPYVRAADQCCSPVILGEYLKPENTGTRC